MTNIHALFHGWTKGRQRQNYPRNNQAATLPVLPQRELHDDSELSTKHTPSGVISHFSGNGVQPPKVVHRQEKRARTITLIMATLVLMLALVSAYLLFDPMVRRPSYHIAPVTVYNTVTTTATIFVNATSTPMARPTATPSQSQATHVPVAQTSATTTTRPHPTSTPQPTATPRPTTTATPIPYADSASITITTAAANLSDPSDVHGCNGCSYNPASGTVATPYITYPNTAFAGNTLGTIYHNGTSYDGIFSVVISCNNGAFSGGCTAPAGATLFNISSFTGDHCTLDNGVALGTFAHIVVNCTYGAAGRQCPTMFGWADLGVGPGETGQLRVTQQNTQCAGGTTGSYYTVPSPCINDNSSAWTNASGTIYTYLRNPGVGDPDILGGPNVSKVGLYCGLSNCAGISAGATTTANTYNMCQIASGWKFAYNHQDVLNLQHDRLVAQVPNGYMYDAGAQRISAVTVTSTNPAGQMADFTCPATGRALYNWTPDQLDALATQIIGLSPSAAQAKIVQLAGSHIQPGAAITVSLKSGAVLPTAANHISFSVLTP